MRARGRAGAVPERTIARAAWVPGHRSAASPRERSPGEAGSAVELDGPLWDPVLAGPVGMASPPGIGLPAPSATGTASTCEEPPSGACCRVAGPNRRLRKPVTAKWSPCQVVPPELPQSRPGEASWAPEPGVPDWGSKPRTKNSRPGCPPVESDARVPRLDRCSNRSGSECRRRKGPKRRPSRY